MEWQTSAPPMDREIEVQTTDATLRTGRLVISGGFGMAATPGGVEKRMRDQFMIKGGELEMFEVKRWREIA